MNDINWKKGDRERMEKRRDRNEKEKIELKKERKKGKRTMKGEIERKKDR